MRATGGSQRCVPSPARAPCSCLAVCCSPGGKTGCLALGDGRHPVGTHFLLVKPFCKITWAVTPPPSPVLSLPKIQFRRIVGLLRTHWAGVDDCTCAPNLQQAAKP